MIQPETPMPSTILDNPEQFSVLRGLHIIDRVCIAVGGVVAAGAVISAGIAGTELIKTGFAQAEALETHKEWTAADLDDKKDKLALVTTGFGGAGILGASLVGWVLGRPEELPAAMPATAIPEPF